VTPTYKYCIFNLATNDIDINSNKKNGLVYSICIKRSSPSTLSPTFTITRWTTPDAVARMEVSIFMADKVAM
jgi:hypothetical protein